MPQLFRHGYAVVVGVGADLPVTADDATAVANLLTDLSRCAYPTDQVKLLTGEKASRENVLKALDWLAHSTDADSTAIVYFSGHGAETPDYFLLTHGYDAKDLASTAIAGRTFTDCLRAIRAKKLLVLLDCCYAGGQAEAKGFIKSPVPPEVIDQLTSISGRVVSASSQKNEVSYTGAPYSVYTSALLEALAGYGAFEQDGYARVLDIAMWLGRQVPARTDDKQHPILKVKDLQDNFAVAWYAGGGKEIRPLSADENKPESWPASGIQHAQFPETPIKPQTNHVPFTNRDHEMRDITSYYAPAYCLLDAPAGYGKSELLKQLEQRFEEGNWCPVYVAISARNTLVDLVHAIAKKLDILFDPEEEIPDVVQLAGKLRQQWERPIEQGRKQGLVLLVDLDKVPSPGVLKDVLETLVPTIEGTLRALHTFETRHNKFRVIIAGRYLTSIAPRRNGVQPSRLPLSPFSYEVIRNTVYAYLPDQAEASTDLLSAHLFHLTGGHPGCMAQILEQCKLRGIAPDFLLNESYSDLIWKGVIRSYVNEIRDNIAQSPKDLRCVLDKVSVFRLLDTDVLRTLNGNLLDGNYTDINLADDLTTTYLLSWHGRFLHDDITRRLLAVRLRQENPQDFQKRCEEARCICAERLQQSYVQSPELWTIEYLFQSLQRFAPSIRHHETRCELREKFFGSDVPAALELFTDTCHSLPKRYFQEQQVLLRAMEEDWEFRFTVNYYMRGTTFDEKPYAQMKQEIDTFFASKHAAGGRNA